MRYVAGADRALALLQLDLLFDQGEPRRLPMDGRDLPWSALTLRLLPLHHRVEVVRKHLLRHHGAPQAGQGALHQRRLGLVVLGRVQEELGHGVLPNDRHLFGEVDLEVQAFGHASLPEGFFPNLHFWYG